MVTLVARAPADLWFADGGACREFPLEQLLNVSATSAAQDVPLWLRLQRYVPNMGRGALYLDCYDDGCPWPANGFFAIYPIWGGAQVRGTAAQLATYLSSIRFTFCPACSEAWYGLTATLSTSASVEVVVASAPPLSVPIDDDHLTWRIYEADTRRMRVRGYVHDAASHGAAGGCEAAPTAIAATVKASYSYTPNARGGGSGAALSGCKRTYAADTEADGSYLLDVSVPTAGVDIPEAMSLTYDAADPVAATPLRIDAPTASYYCSGQQGSCGSGNTGMPPAGRTSEHSIAMLTPSSAIVCYVSMAAGRRRHVCTAIDVNVAADASASLYGGAAGASASLGVAGTPVGHVHLGITNEPCVSEAAAVCTNNPTELCVHDAACAEPWNDPYGGLGCNAGGVAQTCRFCGFGSFPDCSAARASPEPPSIRVARLTNTTAIVCLRRRFVHSSTWGGSGLHGVKIRCRSLVRHHDASASGGYLLGTGYRDVPVPSNVWRDWHPWAFTVTALTDGLALVCNTWNLDMIERVEAAAAQWEGVPRGAHCRVLQQLDSYSQPRYATAPDLAIEYNDPGPYHEKYGLGVLGALESDDLEAAALSPTAVALCGRTAGAGSLTCTVVQYAGAAPAGGDTGLVAMDADAADLFVAQPTGSATGVAQSLSLSLAVPSAGANVLVVCYVEALTGNSVSGGDVVCSSLGVDTAAGKCECTDEAWNTQASNGYGTCGQQMTWVRANIAGQAAASDACEYVAQQASTPECAACDASSTQFLHLAAIAPPLALSAASRSNCDGASGVQYINLGSGGLSGTGCNLPVVTPIGADQLAVCLYREQGDGSATEAAPGRCVGLSASCDVARLIEQAGNLEGTGCSAGSLGLSGASLDVGSPDMLAPVLAPFGSNGEALLCYAGDRASDAEVARGAAPVEHGVVCRLLLMPAAAYARTTRALPLHVAYDTPPGGVALERWLSTVYLTGQLSGASTIDGTLFSVLDVATAAQQCENSCFNAYTSDGYCSDGGPGSEYAHCALGADCADCGPRALICVEGAANNDETCISSPPALDWSGTVVSLHAGVDTGDDTFTPGAYDASLVATATITNSTGTFGFSGLAPGTYTLRVRSVGPAVVAGSTFTPAPYALSVPVGAAGVQLGVVLVDETEIATANKTRVVLRWDAARSDLELRAVFPYNPPCHDDARAVCTGNPTELCVYDAACAEPWSDLYGGLGCNAGGVAQTCRFCGFGSFPDCPTTDAAAAAAATGAADSLEGLCEVFEGRDECAEATWSEAAGGMPAHAITMSAWAPANYSFFGLAQQARLCSGYQMPSSASLPGGAATYVDCVGSCATGRGYCYAAGELCANCVLWEPDAAVGEVSCYAQGGGAQGGPLPGTVDWLLAADRQAPACNYGGTASINEAAAAGISLPEPAPIVAGCSRLEGSLQLLNGATPAGVTVHLPWGRHSDAVRGARGICVNAAAASPAAAFPNARLTNDEYLSWRDSLTTPSPCYEPTCQSVGPWTLHWSSRAWQPPSKTDLTNLDCRAWRNAWEYAVAAQPGASPTGKGVGLGSGACDAHLPTADGVSSVTACGAVPPSSTIVRLALTLYSAGSDELMLALATTSTLGCAAVNGAEVAWGGAVGGWLPLRLHADAGVNVVEFFGYGSGVAADDGSYAGYPEVSLRYASTADYTAPADVAAGRDAISSYLSDASAGLSGKGMLRIGERNVAGGAQLCQA